MNIRHVLLGLSAGALLAGCGGGSAQTSPAGGSSGKSGGSKVAELAKYSGADRQQKLETGAKQEGTLMLYTSSVSTIMDPLVAGFKAKYPFLQVETFRASNEELLPRILQEDQAGKTTMDVLETTTDSMGTLVKNDAIQPFTSPEMANFPKESLQPEGYWGPVRESYVGLGFNTQSVKKDEAPKTHQDLLDPRWKGKMTIAGSSTGVRFVGAILQTEGEDFLKKLGGQQVRVQNVSGRALADLIIAGEVPLSPTIFDSHVADSQKKNAPIDWNPLEPTVVNAGAVAMSSHAPHPYGSVLLLDYAMSAEGQKIYSEHGYSPPRTGMSNTNFKKLYLENVVKDYETEFAKWQQLMRSTFVQA